MSEESNRVERKPYSRPQRGPRPEERKINTEQVVSYLSHAFVRAMQKAAHSIGNRNHKGTCLYRYQTEFCYLVDEIQRGPEYILPKVIQDANQMIVALERETFTFVQDKEEALNAQA
jgi:hypothetical protein